MRTPSCTWSVISVSLIPEMRPINPPVVTTGGMIGRISGIKDTEITLQVQEGVRIRVQRSAVTGRLKTASEPTKTEAKAS